MVSASRNNGDEADLGVSTLRQWVPVVYEKACERAHGLLCRWYGINRPGTASLVHQAFCKLTECGVERCVSREHALALLVQKMRQQLASLARRIHAKKRGGGGARGLGHGAAPGPGPASGGDVGARGGFGAFGGNGGQACGGDPDLGDRRGSGVLALMVGNRCPALAFGAYN